MNNSSFDWRMMFFQWSKLLAGFFLSLLVFSTLANAQSLGTVTGTVTDQSGAVVPKAKVTLLNQGTGETRATMSNDAGYFSLASITPGTYTLRVEVTSFKSWEHRDIPVRPGDLRDVSATLQIGTSTETVEIVTTADEIAPVDSGERSTVITAKQIQNLGLQGRDATELVRTLPGFAAFGGGGIQNSIADPGILQTGSGALGSGYTGNGLGWRNGGTDVSMDGAHIIDIGCDCGSTTTVNGDMVSEVKVQTSNFAADSAKGPLVVNVIGKSGTTEYHGEAYLHARDNGLNALDWAFKHQMLINNSSSPLKISPPSGRFMYPGAQIGGPVPGTNKKLLFHTAFEYYYQGGFAGSGGGSIPGLITDTVPTLSMRQGIFDLNPNVASDNTAFCTSGGNASAPVCTTMYNSTTGGNATTVAGIAPGTSKFGWTDSTGALGGTATTANIPTNAFDAGGAIILANIPKPNANPSATGGFNYLEPVTQDQNGWMWRTRADYNYSENSKFYGTYQIQKETDITPIHLWWQPANSIKFPGGLSSRDNSKTISGHYVKIINSTLTNDLATGIAYVNYPLKPNQPNAWSRATGGIAGTAYPYAPGPYPTKTTMMPQIGNGYWLAGVPQMEQPDIFSANGGTFLWQKWDYSIEDNVTKSYKTHTIKGGFFWERSVNNQAAFNDFNGNFQTTTVTWNASPLQNCFDGNTLCGSNNPVANVLLGTGSFSQVNKLALDKEWEPTYSGYGQDDWKVTRRLTLNLGVRADHLGAWRTSDGSGVPTWTGDLTTEFAGLAWSGQGAKVPITGRDVSTIIWQPRLGLAFDLHGNGKTVLRGGWGEYGYRDFPAPIDLSQGAVQYNSTFPIRLSFDPALGAGRQYGVQGTVSSVPTGCGHLLNITCGNTSGLFLNDHDQPVTRNYNFTISQQLPWSSLLEVAYVGSDSIHGALQGGPQNLNVIPLGAKFAATGCTALQPTNPGGANQNNEPGAPGCSGSVLANLYPFNSDYGSSQINLGRHLGKANYNAMQASWVRNKGRITYNLNYTWSKALGTLGTSQLNGNSPDPTNLRHNYGVLSTDRSHIINLSYVFQEGNPMHGKLGYALNGWSLSGITTWQSGPNLGSLGNVNLGLSGTGPTWFDPNYVPTGPNDHGAWGTYSINSTDYLGSPSPSVMPTVVCNPSAHLKAHQYFNAACFSGPTPTTNGPWQLPYIHGPAWFNSDLAVFKTFKVTERQNVEFRLSAFNFLNHALESFQNQSNGDMTVHMDYQCNGAVGSWSNPCPLGSGKYVVTNVPTGTFKLDGTNIATGYASTKLGRRVLEISAKYTF